MNKGFVEDGFIIDLGNAKDASEIIYELSNILEIPEARNKKICLKLGEIDLSQSQLLSIKSLINSMVSELAFVDTNSEQTELSALNLGIIVSELSNEIEVETPEINAEDFEIKETEVGEPKDGLSYELIEQEADEEEKIEVVEKTEEEIEAEGKLEELIDEENEQLSEKEIAQHEISKLPTLYLQQTLRSGQTMSYDGNIVLVGDAHPGSEIIAKGDITVWGVLGGIAHAGARGNDWAKIRALKVNAIQLRISGFYARRPDSMNIPFIQRSSEFTPEEARVENREIVIYKMSE
ncbi:MAG: septum site-determining protein MinC [Candidatus Gastranaerophilaceae bacterium]